MGIRDEELMRSELGFTLQIPGFRTRSGSDDDSW